MTSRIPPTSHPSAARRGVPPVLPPIPPPPPPPPQTTRPLRTPHIPTPAPQPPASTTTTTITVADFRISTTKRAILNATEIDAMTASIGITPPEMIFGNNEVRVEWVPGLGERVATRKKGGVVGGGEGAHQSVGNEVQKVEDDDLDLPIRWGVVFNAHDALDMVDKTGAGMLKVAYSDAWQRQRERVHEGIKEFVRPFDWSYSTAYRGTVYTGPRRGEGAGYKTFTPVMAKRVGLSPPPVPASQHSPSPETQTPTATSPGGITPSSTPSSTSETPIPPRKPYTFHPPTSPSTTTLPLALLSKPDPILHFDDVILYEDELADNGTSILSVKIRVMPHRLLILARFFLRLDGVLWRVRDTRVYVSFGLDSGEEGGSVRVLRQYTEKEGAWGEVVAGVRRGGGVGQGGMGGGVGGGGGSVGEGVLLDAQRVERWVPVVGEVLEELVIP